MENFSFRRKKPQLMREFDKADLYILALSKPKRKESLRKGIYRGQLLIYSGMKQEVRAREGLWCAKLNKNAF